MAVTQPSGKTLTPTVEYRLLRDVQVDWKRQVDDKLLNDVELMDHIAQGGEAALSELYERYGRLVYSLAYRIVGNRETAEEITLDTFTRVWEKAHTYDEEKSKVSTWLTSLTRNLAIDSLRREQVRPEKNSVSWGALTMQPWVEGDNPETRTNLIIQQERVRQALAALPEPQQEVLALAYFQGLSHSEIAIHLDESLGTIKGRIRSGMKALKALLGEN